MLRPFLLRQHLAPVARGPERGAYRPDIDGLRAVAVSIVVLFHYGVSLFPGGFVGVDVFFVISGFLITAITCAEFEAGRFSLLAFYERRIRRIVPALVVVLFACGVASFFVILPEDMRLLARSTTGAVLFVSNVLFARIANDYFDADNLTLQPLLHTWSLAVEAQFYLVYPLLLLPVRRRPAAMTVVLLLVALASAVLGAWGVSHQPSAAFYLLPGRAWELLLGGFLALALAGPKGAVLRAMPARLADGMSAIGLGMILVPAMAYGGGTPFPGVAAVPPCLGALLVILGGSGGGAWMSAGLSCPPLVALGRISYSLYLWHWPVLVLSLYGRGNGFSAGGRCLALGTALLLSIASWWVVERPFVTRRLLPTRRALLATAVAAVVAGLGLGELLDLTGRGALPLARLPADVLALANGHFDRIEGECPVPQDGREGAYPCRYGASDETATVALWGNSYARMWVPALDQEGRQDRAAGVALIFSKCPPLIGFEIAALPGCAPFNRQALAYIAAHPRLKTVVLGADWFVYGEALSRLDVTLSALQRIGVAVEIVLAPPQADFPVPRALAIAALRHEPPPPPLEADKTRAAQAGSVATIESLRSRFGFRIIDPASALCDGGLCPLALDGHPVFYDAGHVTVFAARRVQGLFAGVFAPAPHP